MAMDEGVTGYGQYCPIVRAVEVLGERWSVLIVRDLLLGTTRFNDLSRGLPGLSARCLSRAGCASSRSPAIVEKRDGEYHLTSAGRDLEPIVFGARRRGGARWAFGPAA